MKILLVEDDDAVIAVVTRRLAHHHYVCDVVKDGEMGWTYGSTFDYDLIVLDIVLPKLDGISLCQKFRAEGYTTPILLLTSQDSSTAKVQGLNAGADDYVLKPFDHDELIARIRALFRRSSTQALPVLTWGDLLLNPMTCGVTYSGKPLVLTTKEYDLLELLLQDSRHVLSSDEILDRLWASEDFPAEATVRSHMRRLRHKLQAVGAPSDFISTLHGRGYYLNPSVHAETHSNESALEPSPVNSTVTNKASLEDQATYLTFLEETWKTTQPNCLEQVAILIEVVQDLEGVQNLENNPLTHDLYQKAGQVAHKLVGTLGIFGLRTAEQIARQLDQLFSAPERLTAEQIPFLMHWVTALHHDIQTTTTIQRLPTQAEAFPLVAIVDSDHHFTEPLAAIALQQALRTEIIPTFAACNDFLAHTLPNLIVLRFAHTDESITFLHSLAHTYPTLPILVVGHRDGLGDRLDMVRRGGRFLLEQSVTPAQIIASAIELINPPQPDAKVMIVDDDADWLNTVPYLLEPWPFKITTLADPQQFWTVLQSVNPDALVLDIKMPEVNGFELCQILRSDPHWQRLPVLFVSALDDSRMQNQAFSAGADDYLCKPVAGMDLANRILSRLARLRSWAIV